MGFTLTILGCNSAVPSLSRFTTSQVLSTATSNFLIDCGEGCQIRFNQFKLKSSRLHNIFISHLHGDHFFGLPGMITSLNLNGRTAPLNIYGPVGIKHFLSQLHHTGSFYLNFELVIHELNPDYSENILDTNELSVRTIPLKHRVPTTGFLFKEKPKPLNILSEKIREFSLSIEEIKQLKAGQNVEREHGQVLEYQHFTKASKTPCSYSYCSDTIYNEDVLPIIENSTVLYHEATYEHALKEKAMARGHSTTIDAATIAQKAKVDKLILGHYSSRYKNLDPILEEARTVFYNTELAEDGKIFEF